GLAMSPDWSQIARESDRSWAGSRVILPWRKWWLPLGIGIAIILMVIREVKELGYDRNHR
ncbi:MAG: hypothetical protein OXF83_02890, partial [Anaerolineaceae bacterium]|nr:hypothetical protein [Anaerolineaceae bacterium]